MSERPSTTTEWIAIEGVRVHNLRDVSLKLPKRSLTVFTGPSGSGKSSLAFDTLFAEGQRRYVESMSVYARQFLTQVEKPDYDELRGLSPTISIEQKSAIHNPRSTVGTITELHDHLRLLYARLGVQWCVCGQGPVGAAAPADIEARIRALPARTRLAVLAPLVRNRKGEFRELFERLRRRGYARVRVDGEVLDLSDVDRLRKTYKHDIDVYIDRLVARDGQDERVADAVRRALDEGEGRLLLVTDEGGPDHSETLFSSARVCSCGRSYPELSHQSFSFNSPLGRCPTCDGLGRVWVADADRVVPDDTRNLRGGAVAPLEGAGADATRVKKLLHAWATATGVSLDAPWRALSDDARRGVLEGSAQPFAFSARAGRAATTTWDGVLAALQRQWDRASESDRERLAPFFRERTCSACHGARLREESRAVRFAGIGIHEVAAMPIDGAAAHFNEVTLADRDLLVGAELLAEIRARLQFLRNVGVGYLSLDRPGPSLSGGEAQRIRLASQLGSELTGVLYVLDEPSIGLHQRDNRQLLETLERLRDRGNTVLVVEHDRDTMLAADWLVDFGPGAGVHGGEVCWAGPGAEVTAQVGNLTGDYLAGRREIPLPSERRRPGRGHIGVRGARGNNLRGIDVDIPVGTFTCVTGVSGAGKSTLVNETLWPALANRLHGERHDVAPHDAIVGLEAFDKVIRIDQQPIGRTPRSNPATYTKVFDEIRAVFAGLPDAKIYGYGPGRFSFNVAGGRCEDCSGAGVRRIEMGFLADVFVECDACRGRRFNDATLRVRYRGRSIADVLAMPVSEAAELFDPLPKLRRRLQTLVDVGLGYISLGQPSTTLSGGEAQRIKLARELSKVATGDTLYVLDEPSTGLHFDDIRKLLDVIGLLVDAGNTVVVIEHNLDIVRTADWVIDLGPEGGAAGGSVVAAGTPEDVARCDESHTGRFLRDLLPPSPKPKPKVARRGRVG